MENPLEGCIEAVTIACGVHLGVIVEFRGRLDVTDLKAAFPVREA